MAAALAGERSTLDTVVYTCCDMLNACELASDMERAAQWCKVADEFVTTYGCPFLYAECRIYYGSVLAAKGRWDDAERELVAGLRITDGACPGLHAKALTRLAALRIRQGRLEEADQLLAHLGEGVEAEAEETLSVSALLLARGDAPAAGRRLEQRLHRLEEHRSHLVAALDLLVDARLAAGDVDGGAAAARRLADVASSVDNELFAAMAAGVDGRVAMGRGDPDAAATHLEVALGGWSRLERPFELARTRFDLARALADAPARRRHRPRPARLGHVRGARRRLRRRSGCGVAPLAGRHRPHRSEAGRGAHRPGAGGPAAPRRRAVEPRDRSPPAREPQDGVAPRQQHPDQARPAQPGRGGRLRRRRARPGAAQPDRH